MSRHDMSEKSDTLYYKTFKENIIRKPIADRYAIMLTARHCERLDCDESRTGLQTVTRLRTVSLEYRASGDYYSRFIYIYCVAASTSLRRH